MHHVRNARYILDRSSASATAIGTVGGVLLGALALLPFPCDVYAAGGDGKAVSVIGDTRDVVRDGASRVRIVDVDGRAALTVNGEPFEIRGVGLGGDGEPNISARVAALAEAGGSAFRTWGPDGIEARLDAAAAHGLMVLVGLDVGQELGGFDYDDTAAVRAQHERLVAFLERYRDHPAVLGWILGNEPNLMLGADGAPKPADVRVYDAIGALARHVREHDPNHFTTLAFSFTPTLAADVRSALARAPELDTVSFQAYGALPVIPDTVTELALDRPFLITEFGPLGHWEMPTTDWGREIEEPSGVKAAGIAQRMTPAVSDDPTGKLLGAFAFLWGQKQERTPTWYGMFIASGERTASVDELHRIWRGRYPANRAPLARAITLDGRPPTASVRLLPDSEALARLDVDDPDGDALEMRWELRREVGARSHGGLFEAVPPVVPLRAVHGSDEGEHGTELHFVAPEQPGEYRLFAYALDGHDGAATANFPFLVEPDPAAE